MAVVGYLANITAAAVATDAVIISLPFGFLLLII
jgi:hypothetical protein